MGLDITRQNLSWTLLSFVLLLGLFWSRALSFPVEVTVSAAGEMPPGALLDRFAVSYPVWGSVLTGLCIFLGGFFMTRMVSRNMILLEKVNMPLLIFLMIGCGPFFDPSLLSIFVMSLLLVMGCDRLVESFRRVRLYGVTFNGSFLLGILPLIYAPACVALLILMAALIVFRKRWRECVVALAGFLLPFAFCSYIYWALGYDFGYIAGEMGRGIGEFVTIPGAFFTRPDPMLLVCWGVLAIITLWSVAAFFRYAGTMRTRPFKTTLFFGWTLLILGALLIAPGRSVHIFPLLAVPLSVFIPLFFNRRADWISNTAYLLLAGSLILYNLLPFLGIYFV